MRKARDFRAAARKALNGRYWLAVLAALIAGILGGTGGSSGGAGASAGGSSRAFSAGDVQQFRGNLDMQMDPAVAGFLTTVMISILTVAVIIGIALFIIGGAVELGYNRFNIHLYESSEKPSLDDLFSRFSIFGRALWLRVLMGLKIFAWLLLLVIPGIIAAYRYAMAPYLMAEHPELTASAAIEKSKELMNGNKGRLFCLGLSFIGWYLLVACTFGIGAVFLAPYVKAAETAFYMDLSGKLPLEEAQLSRSADASAGPETGPVQL